MRCCSGIVLVFLGQAGMLQSRIRKDWRTRAREVLSKDKAGVDRRIGRGAVVVSVGGESCRGEVAW